MPLLHPPADTGDLSVHRGLKPHSLSADLNGDGRTDAVFFVEDQKTGKKGLCLLHSGAKKCTVVGAGKRIPPVGDDFSWVSHWETVPAGETWETTFSPDGDVLGQKTVVLHNASIRLCSDEEGCGLISFRNQKYVWIHQAD
jgi:hypothetical protein